MLTLPQTNGSKASVPAPSWLQSSVQAFFTAINWENNPPEIQQIRQSTAQPVSFDTPSPQALNLIMSVNQFFAAINWDNATIAGNATSSESQSPAKPKDITLDDFSDLF
jgi:hypothetical protein